MYTNGLVLSKRKDDSHSQRIGMFSPDTVHLRSFYCFFVCQKRAKRGDNDALKFLTRS